MVLALAATFAPPEATRDLAAADRLAVANDAAASRATAIVEKSSVACIDASGAPASVADELEWLPVKFDLRVANVLAVPSYQRFARVVARGRSARPTLRAFRAAVAQLAADARLTRMRLDFCSFVDRLGLRLGRLAPGLRQLGLTRAQADRLVTTAKLVL